MATWSVTQVDPVLPTIFNIVVYTVVQYCLYWIYDRGLHHMDSGMRSKIAFPFNEYGNIPVESNQGWAQESFDTGVSDIKLLNVSKNLGKSDSLNTVGFTSATLFNHHFLLA